MSGIFSEAIRQDALDGSNPMREVRIPTRHLAPPKQTHAYGLAEIKKMLNFFGRPVTTLIGLAGFAGLRKGELAGVYVEDWRDGDVWVERSVWRKHITEPKSRKSKAPVPVIAPLRQLLQEHCRDRTEGLMSQSRKGTPLNLDNLAKKVMQPGLAQLGLKWYGWHAFRRGLATNLKQIGVDDKTIQTILRHADYTTTMNHYVLSVPESVRTAMKRFEMFVCNHYATETKTKIA